MIRTYRWAAVALLTGVVLAATACGEAADPGVGDGPAGGAADQPTSTTGGDADEEAPADGEELTVSEALAGDLDGPVTVRGFLIEADGTTRLCEVSMESLPPQCGEPSLRVEGVTVREVDGAQSAQGVTWVDQASLTGTVQDGVLQVSATSS